MSTGDANIKARQRAELRAFPYRDTNAGQSVPVGGTLIDLTEDSRTEHPEGNSDSDSEVEIVD